MSDTPTPSPIPPPTNANTPPPTPPSAAVRYPGADSAKTGNGSGWILALSILQFVGGLVMYGMAASASSAAAAPALGVLVTTMGLGVVFFGLWLWGRKSPFPALLTALIVYVSVHLLDAVVDPMSIVRGIILKVIILVGLGTALKKAYIAKREKELEAAAP